MTAIASAIEKLGAGQAGIARLLRVTPQAVNQWVSGSRPVPPRHVLLIERATGVSRHQLRPDVFGDLPFESNADSAGSAKVADIRRNVDLRMSKRALRTKFGFRTDAHLAVVLGVSAEVIDAWPEGENVPAELIGAVQKLLGHEAQPTQAGGAQDPDEQRIVTLEVA